MHQRLAPRRCRTWVSDGQSEQAALTKKKENSTPPPPPSQKEPQQHGLQQTFATYECEHTRARYKKREICQHNYVRCWRHAAHTRWGIVLRRLAAEAWTHLYHALCSASWSRGGGEAALISNFMLCPRCLCRPDI